MLPGTGKLSGVSRNAPLDGKATALERLAESQNCSFTCDEGLEPPCPLLDLLSLPSLVFLPLDTLADSLSPRGTLSVGTRQRKKYH